MGLEAIRFWEIDESRFRPRTRTAKILKFFNRHLKIPMATKRNNASKSASAAPVANPAIVLYEATVKKLVASKRYVELSDEELKSRAIPSPEAPHLREGMTFEIPKDAKVLGDPKCNNTAIYLVSTDENTVCSFYLTALARRIYEYAPAQDEDGATVLQRTGKHIDADGTVVDAVAKLRAESGKSLYEAAALIRGRKIRISSTREILTLDFERKKLEKRRVFTLDFAD